MPQPKNELSKSLITLVHDRTVIAVIELTLSWWLVGGIVPGIARDPLKNLSTDPERLLQLLRSGRMKQRTFRSWL